MAGYVLTQAPKLKFAEQKGVLVSSRLNLHTKIIHGKLNACDYIYIYVCVCVCVCAYIPNYFS